MWDLNASMDSIEIRFAKSVDEVLQGLDLYCASFPGGYEANQLITQNRSRILIDDHLPDRAIVAVKNGEVIGFFRYCVRQMRLGDVDFDVIGVVDYCIRKSEVSEPLFGIRFMGACLSILRTLKFPFALGSGRRIMESYYARFGFVTCSSYAKCWIEKIPSRLPSRTTAYCEVSVSESYIADYESFRLTTSKDDWGVIYRTSEQWRWIIFRASQFNQFDIVQILNDDVLIGYFIVGKEGVLDFGFHPEHYTACSIAMIIELQKRNEERGDAMVLPVSFNHPIIAHLKGMHFRFEHRCVPDEGIMTVAMNTDALLDVFAAICKRPLNQAIAELFGPGRVITPDNGLTSDEQRTLVNALFMGTASPFFVGGMQRDLLSPTFYRANDIDAL